MHYYRVVVILFDSIVLPGVQFSLIEQVEFVAVLVRVLLLVFLADLLYAINYVEGEDQDGC
jgi:hypothetical protein